MQKEVQIGPDFQPIPHKFEWTLNAVGKNLISNIIMNEQNNNNASIDSVNNVL